MTTEQKFLEDRFKDLVVLRNQMMAPSWYTVQQNLKKLEEIMEQIRKHLYE